jgi:hypothetical protein
MKVSMKHEARETANASYQLIANYVPLWKNPNELGSVDCTSLWAQHPEVIAQDHFWGIMSIVW